MDNLSNMVTNLRIDASQTTSVAPADNGTETIVGTGITENETEVTFEMTDDEIPPDEFSNDCWGWEVDIDISETDPPSQHQGITEQQDSLTGTPTTTNLLNKSSSSKDIRISLKPTLSKGFNTRTESESSIISRVKSSPSFQELERAIGATLAIGLSDTDITKKEEHVKVINDIISHKANLKRNLQQRSCNSLRKAELDAQRAYDIRNDLKSFLDENESRALLLFHSTDVISFDIKAVCQSFGSLYYFRSDFHSLGLTLLCYFDLRCALDAYRLLPSRLGRLASATVHYSVILQVTNNTDESQLKVCHIPSNISEVTIQEKFTQYGPLKSIQKSFIDPGVSPSSPSPPSCHYTIEYFNFQDAKAALSEINSNFTSESSPLPPNLSSLGITSAVLSVQYDQHQERRRKELLNLLSTWRARLNAPLPRKNLSAAAAAAINIQSQLHAPIPLKNSVGHEQAVSIHSPGVTVVYPENISTPIAATVIQSTPPIPSSSPAVESTSQSQARGLVATDSSSAIVEVAAKFGLNTETAEARVARHVMEATNNANGPAPTVSQIPLTMTPPAAASTPTAPPNPHQPQYPYPPQPNMIMSPQYFDPSLAMFTGYPLGYPNLLQLPTSPTDQKNQNPQTSMYSGSPPGQQQQQYGLPQYSTFLVASPYGPVPVTMLSPYASPHGSYENLYALGAPYDSEMWNGPGSFPPHQQQQQQQHSKSRNHHQQYHKQRQQQQQQYHYPTAPSALPQAENQYDYDSTAQRNRPPHHNGGHNAMKRSKFPMNPSSTDSITGARPGGLVEDGAPGSSGGGSNSTLYHLSPDQIHSGHDNRTTLMIRNIPNKYTQSMLLEEINQKFDELYDFFYLPIDFKNRCNVGYAFINFIVPGEDILKFYHEFHGQKWRNFNSEKICSITYARIQGKAAMITRFQNSSLLEKDESYKPLLFISKGPEKGKPEPFPALKGNGGNSYNQQQLPHHIATPPPYPSPATAAAHPPYPYVYPAAPPSPGGPYHYS
jgi:hypothetical protein